MHLLFKILFIPTVLFSGKLYAQKSQIKTPPTAGNTQQVFRLRNVQDSVQYSLGAYLGRFMIENGFLAIDPNYLFAGMQDVFQKRPRLISDSIQLPILNAYQRAVVKERGKALETQLFSALKDKEGVGKLPSGVQYTILKPGKGPRPSETDTVLIHFKGVLADGTVFEDSYAKKIPQITTPGNLVPGVNESLQLMQPGSIWQLFIPSNQAWGEKGNGTTIPPNSAISILIELLEVRRK